MDKLNFDTYKQGSFCGGINTDFNLIIFEENFSFSQNYKDILWHGIRHVYLSCYE